MLDNEGPLVVGISILTLALGGIFVFARVLVRTLINPVFGTDDALIIFTWFIILGFNVSYFVAVSHGFGQHAQNLTLPDLLSAARASIIGEVFAVFAYPSGKAAVAFLLMRVFPIQGLKWFLWTFVAANALLFYLNGILLLVQCTPVAYQWDKSIQGGYCWSPEVLADWGYLTGAVGALTDLVFAVVPWFYIARLQTSLRRKIIVGAALGMGLLPFICSILKIYYTSTLASNADPTFDTVPLVLTSAAELCAINIAACIPTLRPLYLWLTGRKANSEKASTYKPENGRYEYVQRRFNPFSRKDNAESQLASFDKYENHIMQLRTYDVTVEPRGDNASEETKIDGATFTTVTRSST